jgi:hypothetical protein
MKISWTCTFKERGLGEALRRWKIKILQEEAVEKKKSQTWGEEGRSEFTFSQAGD